MKSSCKPWTERTPPRRILAIRLQALGDVVITLPYLQRLRNSIDARLDFLTRKEIEDIPRNLDLFDHVYSIGGGRDSKRQLLSACLLLPQLLMRRYDVIIDLQNSTLSRIVRTILRPAAWSAFDRFSPRPAGERNRLTIEAIGLGSNQPDNRLQLRRSFQATPVVRSLDPTGTVQLVVLNPAGAFATRNWEMHKYVLFARQWLQRWPDTRFLVLGTSFIAEKATFLQSELGECVINLVGQTTPAEAFYLLQRVTLVLSEDSGLMHMAWVSGTPVVALFGSTRGDWSRPLGPHSLVLDSSDLSCGNCMQETCRRGDVFCLTRRTAEDVFSDAVSLLQRSGLRERPRTGISS
ncbi:MAG TPA: glycosyltransferase family 9 protein [Chthonomonadales bacterium]|nr:glycosyltransferase family 9 protein [Chthonomonadales bacterium]